ncbi:MAG: sulfoxide reductase heme-binding subunit YedZ [Gammaproteobacteria bacterium]|nr:sulfoxide reductase heme-binding subunit YedZ [Gammaproteobacteria bacterium]
MNSVSAAPVMDRPRQSLARAVWFKPLVFVLALVPMALLVWSVVSGDAGPNPIEYLEKSTGEWSLRFLWLSLLLTPLSEWFKTAWPVRIRRMIGLYAFFYVGVHFCIYLVLDQSLDLGAIWLDLVERPYITAGFAALLILLPLAITSNRYMVRKLKQRWKSLHRWVYIAAIAAILHYIWLAKGDRIEPLVYLGLLIVLLGYRVQKLLGQPQAR